MFTERINERTLRVSEVCLQQYWRRWQGAESIQETEMYINNNIIANN